MGIVATIATDKTLYYLACKQCKRKVIEENGKYYCKNCNETNDNCNVVYTFSMKIEDGTDGIWISVFGDNGEKILNKTAEEVKNEKDSGKDWQMIFKKQRNKVKNIT